MHRIFFVALAIGVMSLCMSLLDTGNDDRLALIGFVIAALCFAIAWATFP